MPTSWTSLNVIPPVTYSCDHNCSHITKEILFVTELLTESQCKVPEDLNDSSQMIPWTIDTKYYTASVDIWLDHIESDAEEAVKAFVDDKNGICEVVDCLVLVFRKDEVSALFWK